MPDSAVSLKEILLCNKRREQITRVVRASAIFEAFCNIICSFSSKTTSIEIINNTMVNIKDICMLVNLFYIIFQRHFKVVYSFFGWYTTTLSSSNVLE